MEKNDSVFCGAEELREEFLVHFPKLAEEGGYELLRMRDAIYLEVIGYSVEYLKSVVSSAKIYVRPLQRDLDTDQSMVSSKAT